MGSAVAAAPIPVSNVRQRRAVFDRQRLACIVLAGLVPVLLRLLLLPWFPPPLPAVPDESAHLLVGQTFAEGRVTNPTHPMWQHFESLFILQQPTYTGKYQPGYGATVALGMRLARHPWAGTLLTEALALSVLTWVLFLWLPRRWAMLGAALMVAQVGAGSFWTNTYLGVPTTAIGGALWLACLRLTTRRCRTRDVLLGGVGIAILMFTRPYDAVLLAGLLVIVRGWRVVLPLTAVLAPALAVVLWYNAQVTGSAWKLPYQVAREQYGVPQTFFWEKPVQHTDFRHAEVRRVYEAQLEMHETRRHPLELLALLASRVVIVWRDYFHVGWLPVLLFVPAVLAMRSMRLLTRVLAAFLIAQGLYFYFAGAYLAPVYGALVIVLVQAVRLLRWKAPRAGVAALAMIAAGPVVSLAAIPLGITLPGWLPSVQKDWFRNPVRAAVYAELGKKPSPQLVIVRYGEGHDLRDEYVYNTPRIDDAHVVWARDMGEERNEELFRYYPQREAWLLEPDAKPYRLTPLTSKNH